MRKIIVGHVKHPPHKHECIRCDRASPLGNPYTFIHENYRDRSIKACRQWLWENIKLAKEVEQDSMAIELMGTASIAPKKVEGLTISTQFKNPSVLQVIQKLELIAKVANTKGDVALLCWCRGKLNSSENKACHCDVLKSCIENLFL